VSEPLNRVIQVRRFGAPDVIEVVDAPTPTAGPGEVRVRVLASSVEYTDVRSAVTSTRKRRLSDRRSFLAMMSSGKSISSGLA